MRDRLVELVDKAKKEYANDVTDHTETEYIVEGLLNEGAIVPPCKVGNVVYEVDLPKYGIIVCKVTKVLYDSEEVIINVIDGHGKGSEYYFEFDDFGKTVFLTREEAEAKLKERKEYEGK